MAYYPYFEDVDYLKNISSDSFLVVMSNKSKPEPIEPGFVLYTSIVKSIFDSWKVFVFITTLIPILSISYFIKKNSTNFAFSFSIFFALYLGLLIDLMRNGMAIAAFLFAIQLMREKKYALFIVFILLAITFHNSILVLVPILLLNKYKIPSFILWLMFAIVNIIFIANIPIVSKLLSIVAGYVGGDKLALTIASYLNSDMAARGFTLGYIIRVVVFFVMMRYRKAIYSNDNMVLLFNAYFVSILISLGLADMNLFATRMEMNLFFPFIILYPYLLHLMSPIKRRLFAYFLSAFCILKIFGGQNTIMAQYETMFSGSTYEKMYQEKRNAADIIMDL